MCVNAVSMVFMGQPVLGALVANAFPVVNQGSEFSLFRSDNRFGVSVSGINLYFCETNSNCPSEWLQGRAEGWVHLAVGPVVRAAPLRAWRCLLAGWILAGTPGLTHCSAARPAPPVCVQATSTAPRPSACPPTFSPQWLKPSPPATTR